MIASGRIGRIAVNVMMPCNFLTKVTPMLERLKKIHKKKAAKIQIYLDVR